MLRRFGLLALFFVLVMTGSSWPAHACSCNVSGPACQAYWKTDAVFDATVVSITLLSPAEPRRGGQLPFAVMDKVVKLEVRQSWKGVETGPLEITTSGEGGSCGYPFKVGGRYLIFAFQGRIDGRLQASICSRTQEFNGTGGDVDFLASLDAPAPGGRVFGRVRTALRASDARHPRIESDTETLVRLLGGPEEKVTRSSGGRYEFTGLPEGSFSVEVTVPDGYTTYSTNRPVRIPDRRACAEENYWLSPTGKITGRLIGPDGRGLPQVRVEVTSPDAWPHFMHNATESATTDAEGHFDIPNVSPGRYIAGVNLRDLPSQYNPYARVMYPGEAPEPEILTLALGQIVDLGTWQMPPPLPVVRVPGIVTWSDGAPAVGVYVGASDRTGNPVESARGAGGVTSGEGGRFVLELRLGRVYTFWARDPQSKWIPVSAPRLEIGTGAPEPLRIVLRRPPVLH